MTSTRIRIGLSACFFHADPARPVFKGKTLLYLEQSMTHWVIRGGGLPLMIPSLHGEIRAEDYLDQVDGLILQGGSDVCPKTYGEEPMRPEWNGDSIRDHYEISLVLAAMKKNKPVLGVCRGLQLLNVALGGTLYQDIKTQVQGAQTHRDWDKYDQIFHDARFEPGSWLGAWYSKLGSGKINTVHHQAIKDLSKELVVEAVSVPDGIIEAVRHRESGEDPSKPWVYAVQWHPEFQNPSDATLLPTEPILKNFFAAISKRRNLK